MNKPWKGISNMESSYTNKMRNKTIGMTFAFMMIWALFVQAAENTGENTNPQPMDDSGWERLLFAGYGYDKIQILNRSGEVEWEMQDKSRVCDVWMLEDGNIIISAAKEGTKIIKPDLENGGGEVVWHRPIKQGGESHSCQPLDNGYFLIGESYDGVSYLVEVNREMHERKRIEIKGIGEAHKTFRNVRKTPEGTYLIGAQAEGYKGRRAIEIDAQGNILRRFPGGGYLALRLPNGNTLLSSGDKHLGDNVAKIFEVNPEGEVVWKVEKKDLPDGMVMGYIGGLQRLPNGNTLVCNAKYHLGPNADPNKAIFEITPDKKIVWTSPDDIENKVTSALVMRGAKMPCWLTVVKGMSHPESIICWSERELLFASNIETDTAGFWEKDGEGFISLLKYDGTVVEKRWLDSKPGAVLNAPKGLGLLDGYLYIADIDRLLRVPIEGQRQLELLPVQGLQRANDIIVKGSEVFVSDTKAGKIYGYTPADKSLREIPAPLGVNGMAFHGERMFAVSVMEKELYELDPRSLKPPRAFGLAEHDYFKTLDGIRVMPDGQFIVTDFSSHRIMMVDADEKTVKQYCNIFGPTDLELDAEKMMLFVPQGLGTQLSIFDQKGSDDFLPISIRSFR